MRFLCYTPPPPPSWPGALFAVLGACNPLLRWVWATESAGCHPVSCSVLACTRGLERGCLRESFECARDFVCAACKTYTTPILQRLLANCTSAGQIFTRSRQVLSEALNMSMNVLSHLGRREFLQFLKSNWTSLSLWKAFYLYIKGQCSSKWCAGNSSYINCAGLLNAAVVVVAFLHFKLLKFVIRLITGFLIIFHFAQGNRLKK